MNDIKPNSAAQKPPRVSFWIHPTEGPWPRKRFAYGFSLVIFKRGFFIGTRSVGLFSWAKRPVLWPRDRRLTW